MKPTTKKLYIIGLCIFCFSEIIGILKLLYELFINLPNGSLIGVTKEYISILLWTTIISIVIKIIITFIIVFMITRMLKNVKSKCLIPLICCSTLFLIIILTSLWTGIISIAIKTILALIFVFMITRILKNIKSKCLIPSLCCSIIFLIINIFSFSIPAIPKYLIYSKLGIIETYLVCFVNYLTNGTIFSMVAYIIILVASIKNLRVKKKGAEMDG